MTSVKISISLSAITSFFPSTLIGLRFKEFVHMFVFDFDYDNGWSPIVREMLVCTAIYHYDDFVRVVMSHPDGEFGSDESKHTFICRFQRALNLAGVSQPLFDAWKKEIRDGFVNRNLTALPYPEIETRAGPGTSVSQLLMDPRTFVSQTNNLVSNYQSMQGLLVSTRDQVSCVSDEVLHLRTENKYLGEKLDYVIGELSRTTEAVFAMYQVMRSGGTQVPCVEFSPPTNMPAPATHPVTPTSLSSSRGRRDEAVFEMPYVAFSSSSRFMNNQSIQLSRQFVYFFSYQAHKAYKEEQTTQTWKDMDKSERKKITNRMKSLKEVVRFMCLLGEEIPPDPPLGNPSEYKPWLVKLNELAEYCQDKVHEYLLAEGKISESTQPSDIKNKHILSSRYFKATKETALAKEDNACTLTFDEDAPAHILDFFDPKGVSRKRKRDDSTEVETVEEETTQC